MKRPHRASQMRKSQQHRKARHYTIKPAAACFESLEVRQAPAGVTATIPLAESHDALVSTNIAATFDANINNATVNDQTFVVHARESKRLLTANGDVTSLGAGGMLVTLNPAADFNPGELVQVTATAGIQDTSPAPVAPHVWQFRTAVSSPTPGLFEPSSNSLASADSFGVSLGDVDGDGDLDAFVANLNAPNRLWLNDGTGNFSASSQSLANVYSLGVSLGDLDGDGDLDAFVANDGPNRVWLNDGSGNFTASSNSLGDEVSWGVSLGDVDGDGDLDAFVANYSAPDQVWLNDGSGNFNASSNSLGNQDSFGVSLGDVDGDGDLDAFVANDGPNRVWLNDGSGNFTASSNSLGDAASFGVSLGDVDGDGDLDAFVANLDASNQVWLNDGNGNFSDSSNSLGDTGSRGVSLGDVDGDGDLDAFIANYIAANQVWLNDGSGNFTASSNSLGDSDSQGVSLGDVDGDGDLDAFVVNGNYQANRVWLNVIESRILDRHIFYNQSAFDGNDPAPNAADDGAIAPDKEALLPGQAATFENYTSYIFGINGIMIDVLNLPNDGADLTLADFDFKWGNDDTPGDWTDGPDATQIAVRPHPTDAGVTRVTLIWPNNALSKGTNCWVQVTMLANDRTGLIAPDAHYWGNAFAETGNVPGSTSVDSGDISGVTNNLTNFLNPALIDNDFDFNRDKVVDVGDRTIAVNSQTVFFNELRLITPPSPPAAPPSAAAPRYAIALAIDGLFGALADEDKDENFVNSVFDQ